jgi:hypothetical protein
MTTHFITAEVDLNETNADLQHVNEDPSSQQGKSPHWHQTVSKTLDRLCSASVVAEFSASIIRTIYP